MRRLLPACTRRRLALTALQAPIYIQNHKMISLPARMTRLLLWAWRAVYQGPLALPSCGRTW